MSAHVFDGIGIAKRLRAEIAVDVKALTERGVTPCLAVILVGENPASEVYVRGKERDCKRVGMKSILIRMDESTPQDELLKQVNMLNADMDVHGILVQMPLPRHIDPAAVTAAISPEKDADGFTALNCGQLLSGRAALEPCTPKGCMYVLEQAGIDIAGKNAVVIGRSNTVGKPMALMLLRENATVTICHSRTRDLPEVARRADILVAAIGRPRFVTADMVKPGAVVIDVGINRLDDGTLCGDVDFDAVKEIAGAITPAPGCIGLLTRAMLLKNTVVAAQNAT